MKGYAQLKEIPVAKLNAVEEKGRNCMDSSGVISTSCSLDLDGFEVQFYKVFFDKKANQLRVIGRTCTSDQANSIGVSNVTIFEGLKKSNVVKSRKVIGQSTYSEGYIENSGFFDITVDLFRGQSLFFHKPRFFIIQYNVSKLL